MNDVMVLSCSSLVFSMQFQQTFAMHCAISDFVSLLLFADDSCEIYSGHPGNCFIT